MTSSVPAGTGPIDDNDVMTKRSHIGLVTTLAAVVLTAAVEQNSVVPILSTIEGQLQVSPIAVGWVVSANLLAAAASAPLVGRLADLYNKKKVLLGALAVVLLGSLLCALTSSFPLLVIGRALQATSFAAYPVVVAILRDEMPAERIFRAVGVISAAFGLGSAMALLFTGFLMPEGASYQRLFWLLATMTVGVMALCAVVVPSRPRVVTSSVDWFGAAALACGLCLLLLTTTQGATWGWVSPPTLAAGAGGIVVMAMWWRWNQRCSDPLVSPALLRRGPLALVNGASLLVGAGTYFSLLGLSTCAATPATTGHGFGADAREVSLRFLLPGAVAAAAAAFAAGRIIERLGARTVMLGSGVIGVIGFVMFTQLHARLGPLLTAGLLTSIYISLAYGAVTALIITYVDPGEIGIAESLNDIFYSFGEATAAATVGPLLVSSAASGTANGYVILFSIGAVTTALSAVLVQRPSFLFRPSAGVPQDVT
jgi:MFS family permease